MKPLLIIVCLVLCVIATITARAGETEATNAAARLRALEQQAAAPWQALRTNIATHWSVNNPATLDYRWSLRNPTGVLSLTRLKTSRWMELRQRMNNPADALANLDEYRPALALPGVAREIYERAGDFFWQGDYARATPLFTLLVSPTNPDGFVLGNSHYWLGFLLNRVEHKPDAALPHFLAAHRYPACLVYIDAAGREAAQIYYARGRNDAACAILAQQIPSIDYWLNEHKRGAAGFDIARGSHDASNVVRNLLRMQRSAAHVSYAAADAADYRRCVADWLAPGQFDAIAAYVAAVEPWPVYQAEIISRALAGPEQGGRDPALTDLLLHDWPSLEDVTVAAPVVLTNRPLSNNVFPQRRRPAPHGVASQNATLTNHLSELQP